MSVSTIIRHPAVRWLRRIVALPLGLLGLLLIVAFFMSLPLDPHRNSNWQFERLDHFRQAERFVTTYLDKNGHLPDRRTVLDWFERTSNVSYDGEYYVAGLECAAPGFAKMKLDRFVISNWRGNKGTECYASPSGKHTVMWEWESFWREGRLYDGAASLAAGSVLLLFAWMIWPDGRPINARPPWLRRTLALLSGAFVVTLLAACGNAYSIRADGAAHVKMVKDHYREAALMAQDYRNKRGQYPNQAVMTAWLLQRLPLFNNISIGQDCEFGDAPFQDVKSDFMKGKGDLFILVGDKGVLSHWGPVYQCYAYPSGKSTLSDVDMSSLILGWQDFLLLAATGWMAWLAWRLWPRRAQPA